MFIPFGRKPEMNKVLPSAATNWLMKPATQKLLQNYAPTLSFLRITMSFNVETDKALTYLSSPSHLKCLKGKYDMAVLL